MRASVLFRVPKTDKTSPNSWWRRTIAFGGRTVLSLCRGRILWLVTRKAGRTGLRLRVDCIIIRTRSTVRIFISFRVEMLQLTRWWLPGRPKRTITTTSPIRAARGAATIRRLCGGRAKKWVAASGSLEKFRSGFVNTTRRGMSSASDPIRYSDEVSFDRAAGDGNSACTAVSSKLG